MRLCYLLVSPTWGMHQYTADLANRQAVAGAVVHLVTTRGIPGDRYAPAVTVHTPVTTRDRGFSPDALRPCDLRRLLRTLRTLRPDLVHITGPHLWNPLLLSALRRARVPTVHTLHDLHPHAGAVYGRLLYLWNSAVRHQADHLLVHGRRYRDELLAEGGGGSGRVTYLPLTHLFVSYEREEALRRRPVEVRYESWALFFGRLERYKGLDVLAEALRRLGPGGLHAVVAGPGRWQDVVRGPLPDGLELRERLVGDEEAVDLFAGCGLVVLPYVEASQSALVAAAYFFRKPVVVTRVGALPEYVVEGETGWVIPPGDPEALAGILQSGLADPVRLSCMGRAGRAWYERERQAEGRALREMYASVARVRGSGEEGEDGEWVRRRGGDG